jgi:hypothetical protein
LVHEPIVIEQLLPPAVVAHQELAEDELVAGHFAAPEQFVEP